MVEQLYNNNNNNQNNQDDDNNDDDSNSNTNANSANNIPLAAPAIISRRESEDRRISGLKWAQLMRQHRYQLRQLQDQQQQGRARGGQGQYDAAAESWRKLQQALQAQIDADNENYSGYELTKWTFRGQLPNWNYADNTLAKPEEQREKRNKTIFITREIIACRASINKKKKKSI